MGGGYCKHYWNWKWYWMTDYDYNDELLLLLSVLLILINMLFVTAMNIDISAVVTVTSGAVTTTNFSSTRPTTTGNGRYWLNSPQHDLCVSVTEAPIVLVEECKVQMWSRSKSHQSFARKALSLELCNGRYNSRHSYSRHVVQSCTKSSHESR